MWGIHAREIGSNVEAGLVVVLVEFRIGSPGRVRRLLLDLHRLVTHLCFGRVVGRRAALLFGRWFVEEILGRFDTSLMALVVIKRASTRPKV